jgi:anaerobic magnesium-protoporphyrin IX monomethyl ester cyclase
MRIALIYPEVYDIARFRDKRKEFPPFGVLYLAAQLEIAGYTVSIRKVSPDNNILDLSDYDAVGISIASSATYNLLKDCLHASRLKSGALVMVGGVHANLFPELTLTDFPADVVCCDEGEIAILQILEKYTNRDFGQIAGICYIGDHGVIRTAPRYKEKHIDWLPLPARHLLPISDFVMSDRLSSTDLQMAHVMLSRGCPFPCRFCAVSQSKMQYRSGASARHELIHLKEVYGIDGFAIVDDNFVVNKKKVSEISDAITDLKLFWSALSRTDTVDHNLLGAMAASGCIELKYGLESGSDRMLRAMDKRISIEQAIANIKDTYEFGIRAKLFLIHGYPGENESSTRETMNVLENIRPYVERVSLFRYVPLPGTYAYNRALEIGIKNTHLSPGWDGNWSRFHIHANDEHWWGDDSDFRDLQKAFAILNDYVLEHWPDQHGQPNS